MLSAVFDALASIDTEPVDRPTPEDLDEPDEDAA
jgi:hypothetical protein